MLLLAFMYLLLHPTAEQLFIAQLLLYSITINTLDRKNKGACSHACLFQPSRKRLMICIDRAINHKGCNCTSSAPRFRGVWIPATKHVNKMSRGLCITAVQHWVSSVQLPGPGHLPQRKHQNRTASGEQFLYQEQRQEKLQIRDWFAKSKEAADVLLLWPLPKSVFNCILSKADLDPCQDILYIRIVLLIFQCSPPWSPQTAQLQSSPVPSTAAESTAKAEISTSGHFSHLILQSGCHHVAEIHPSAPELTNCLVPA